MASFVSPEMNQEERWGGCLLLVALSLIGFFLLTPSYSEFLNSRSWWEVLKNGWLPSIILYQAFRGGSLSMTLVRFGVGILMAGIIVGGAAELLVCFHDPAHIAWEKAPKWAVTGIPVLGGSFFLGWTFFRSRSVHAYLKFVRYEESLRSVKLTFHERLGVSKLRQPRPGA